MTKKRGIRGVLHLILIGGIVGGTGITLLAQQPLKLDEATTKSSEGMRPFVPDEILVKFRPDATAEQIRKMTRAPGITVLEMNRRLDLYRLGVSRPVEEAVTFAGSQSFVETARPNYILAEAGDDVVTLLDMESLIDEVNPLLRRVYTRKEAKENLLRSLVDYKLLTRAAREEEFDEREDVKRIIKATVEKKLAQAYLRQITASPAVTEKEMKDYYERHREEFRIPEQVTVRHIVVPDRKEAEAILEKIKGGAEFEKMARENSIDGSAQWGGKLGWFGRGRMDPAFEEVAFALNPGEIGGVVKTAFGFHIIKGEGRRGPEQKTFASVKDGIRQTLQKRKHKEEDTKKRKALNERYGTRLYEQSLSEVNVKIKEMTDRNDFTRALQEMVESPY